MRWLRFLGASALAALGAYVATAAGCASMGQASSDVYRREAGGRLEPWKNAREASEIHWPFAWAAVAAYQDSHDPAREPLDTSQCPDPDAFLSSRGWIPWDRMPSIEAHPGEPYAKAAQAMRDVHLRAEVWANPSTNQVVVGFGGTAAGSWNDWKSNLRWAVIDPHDEYTVLTDTFVPTFVEEFLRRAGEPDGRWLKGAKVIATGHSLGGGLAQRFAYSLQADSGVPPVKEVYAFDPSPVSGKRSSPDFDVQAKGLTIYRIYNRGEILASLRSLVRLGNPGDRRNQGQTWVDMRYRDDWTWRTLLPSGSVHAHGMRDFACFIADRLPTAEAPAAPASAAR